MPFLNLSQQYCGNLYHYLKHIKCIINLIVVGDDNETLTTTCLITVKASQLFFMNENFLVTWIDSPRLCNVNNDVLFSLAWCVSKFDCLCLLFKLSYVRLCMQYMSVVM